MKKVGSFVGDWWRLVSPYFKSEDGRWAIPLLVGAIALTFSGVGLEVLFNDWNRRFYDALQNKDEATFWREILTFSWLAALFIVVGIARAIVSPYLRLRWRRWLTKRYLAHWRARVTCCSRTPRTGWTAAATIASNCSAASTTSTSALPRTSISSASTP